MLAYSYLRFSSSEQRKGDSIRRQIAKRDAYLTAKGLTLDDSLVFADKGMSSFRGKNAIDGELRFFLDCVKAGRIRKGSYLIVENLDRLFIRRRVSDDHVADDLLQETFLRIHRNVGMLHDADRLAGWV